MYRNMNSGNHWKSFPNRIFLFWSWKHFRPESLQDWAEGALPMITHTHDKVVTSVYFAKKWVTSRTTEDMAKKQLCVVKYLSRNRKFPSFYLQFSQNVFLLSHTEIWSHFQNTWDCSRNLSQFAEPGTLTDSVLLLLGTRKVQVHLKYLPIPSQQQELMQSGIFYSFPH